MDDNKLKQIIDRKNERLEEYAVSRAGEIIDEIANQQSKIQTANAKIDELRGELKKLMVESIDATEILGAGGGE